jgi:methylated-DNA-[protein]-cysteine S-methyltransferase
METWFTRFETAVGPMLLTASAAGVTGAYFDGENRPASPPDGVEAPAQPIVARARRQIEEYLDGRRTTFDVPLDLRGTPFQRRVWQALLGIAHGDTVSYADVARRLGGAASPRAVGAAVGRNPVAIIVPCHRVVGADGSLTGYAGGLARKRALLNHEKGAGPLFRMP